VGYRVKTDAFEGPFDLLLHLVSRHKVDVRTISITEVTGQYLEYVERFRDLDLDVASDFLLIAATLLEIKAAALLPAEEHYAGDEIDDLSPEEARELLVARLLAYRQFKSVAAELAARMEAEGRTHPRQAGLEDRFLGLMPDFLDGFTLRGFAVICADLIYKREVFLLHAEHVAAAPISLELHTESVSRTLASRGSARFTELLGEGATPETIVVTLLAILELYKRGRVDLRQDRLFDDILVIACLDGVVASSPPHARTPEVP